MQTSPAADKPVVILIGNYPLDRQESMLRFRNLVQARLESSGFTTESIFPRGYLGRIAQKGGLAKWFGYIDKYILFPLGLAMQLSAIKRKFAGRKIVVHICDHSNAVYVAMARRWFPVLVTCHDLLAVRGALGEDTDCPASGFGKRLQAAILRGLGKATPVVCVSAATQSDLVRLRPGHRRALPSRSAGPQLCLSPAIPRRSPGRPRARRDRSALSRLCPQVGSALRRKNREALLYSVAQIKESWPGQIVFAGEPLIAAGKGPGQSLGLEKRVREISRPGQRDPAGAL